jgi:hypothetical protein
MNYIASIVAWHGDIYTYTDTHRQSPVPHHVVVAVALGLAEADAVDDGGVVERVADDGVLGAQDLLEEPRVGVEAGGVEDGVVHAVEASDLPLQLLVDVLRAADEAHAAQAEAVSVQGLLGRAHEIGVVRQPEVIVGAEVEGDGSAGQRDLGVHGAADDPLVLPRARGLDAAQLAPHAVQEAARVGGVHVHV